MKSSLFFLLFLLIIIVSIFLSLQMGIMCVMVLVLMVSIIRGAWAGLFLAVLSMSIFVGQYVLAEGSVDLDYVLQGSVFLVSLSLGVGVATDRIRKKKQENQILLDTMDTLLIHVNREQKIIEANAATARFVKKDREDLKGMSLAELYTLTEARVSTDEMKRIFRETKEIQTYEWHTNQEGEDRLLAVSKTPFFDGKGKMEKIFFAARDITEYKRMTEELERGQQRLQAILEDQTELICRFKPGGILTYVNGAYCRYFGKEHQELIGKSFMPLIPQEDMHISQEHVASLNKDNPVTYYKHRVILSDGSIRWQAWTDRAIFNEQGDIIEYQAVGRDITEEEEAKQALEEAREELERKVQERTQELYQSNNYLRQQVERRTQTEKMLAGEKERLAVTLKSIADGVVATDREGRVIVMNEAAEIISGWTREKAIGLPLNQILPFVSQEVVKHSPSGEKISVSFLAPSGKHARIEYSQSTIQDHEYRGQVLVFQDVTERENQKERQALSQRLESIGILTAGIAHEINTPMQYIKNNIQYLEKRAEQVYPLIKEEKEDAAVQMMLDYEEDIIQAIKESKEGIQQVEQIIQDMKTFTHPGTHEKKEADLNRAILGVLRISQKLWQDQATINKDLDSTMPGIPCVISQINQAILNIFINAVQAVEEACQNGKIEEGIIDIKTSHDCDFVHVSIEDNGMGIPQEQQKYIFDSFFTTKDVHKGTGLGLPLAYSIIKGHGGSLDIMSEEGKGTKAEIRLPRYERSNNNEGNHPYS